MLLAVSIYTKLTGFSLCFMNCNLNRSLAVLLVTIISLNFSSAQDPAKAVKPDTKDSLNPWSYFLFFGAGNGFYRKGYAAAFAGTLSVGYKSHLFSLGGGGALTPTEPYRPEFFNYGYGGFLFGERIKYKHIFSSLSTGLAYGNLEYSESMPGMGYNYERSGISIPVELKVAVIAKTIGIGINFSKHFIPTSKYSPFLITLSIVFAKWN